jgi:hypothetical protein
MRTVLVGLLGLMAMTPAQAGDLAVPPAYGAAPPPAYVQAPPAYVQAPPAYVQVPPPPLTPYDYVPPPPYPARSVIAAPQGPAYIVPGYAYQPGTEYVQAPALVDGTRYRRECWFEFGQRRCSLRHRAVFW